MGFVGRTLGASSTCKPWYDILAHDSAAYSMINLGDFDCSHHLAESFARKSAPRPLRVAWVDTGHGIMMGLANWEGAFCARYIHRIKSLQYEQTDLETDRELPAPRLGRCSLHYFVRGEDEDDDEDDEDTEDTYEDFDPKEHIFPILFGGNSPKLRALDLHEVRLAWCPSNYSDLTRLTITFHPELLTRTALDTDDLTVIFRNSPVLNMSNSSPTATKMRGSQVWRRWLRVHELREDRDGS